MKFRFLLIVVLALVSLSGSFMQPALAQTASEPTGLKNVTLWLNPEYDDPRLLVMLEGKITGATAPTRIRFLVPTAAEMYSAGSLDAAGKYSGGPPERKTSEIPGWDEISYQLTTDTFRMEYYDDIIIGQPDKEISYYFQMLYPINDLSVVVQEPRTASNFKVTPEGSMLGKDSEAFNVYRYSFNNLLPTSPLHFDITYNKTNPHPSLIDVTSPGTSPTTGSTGSSGLNVPLLIGVIAGVFAVVAFIFLMNRRPKPKAVKYSSKADRAARRREAGTRFCSQCGRQVDEGHQFCPYCGNKVG